MDTPSVLIFFLLARSSISLVGSEPGLSRQMSGTRARDSAHARCGRRRGVGARVVSGTGN
jgi:hypothetical protein